MDIKFKLMLFKEKYLRKDHIKRVISHPFLILILGAIISSLIFPYFTRQWQDNQKQLELKTALADDINKAVSDSTASARLFNTGRIDSKDFDNTFKNWEINKEMISSRIQSYFSNNQATQNWNNLASTVEELAYYI